MPTSNVEFESEPSGSVEASWVLPRAAPDRSARGCLSPVSRRHTTHHDDLTRSGSMEPNPSTRRQAVPLTPDVVVKHLFGGDQALRRTAVLPT